MFYFYYLIKITSGKKQFMAKHKHIVINLKQTKLFQFLCPKIFIGIIVFCFYFQITHFIAGESVPNLSIPKKKYVWLNLHHFSRLNLFYMWLVIQKHVLFLPKKYILHNVQYLLYKGTFYCAKDLCSCLFI